MDDQTIKDLGQAASAADIKALFDLSADLMANIIGTQGAAVGSSYALLHGTVPSLYVLLKHFSDKKDEDSYVTTAEEIVDTLQQMKFILANEIYPGYSQSDRIAFDEARIQTKESIKQLINELKADKKDNAKLQELSEILDNYSAMAALVDEGIEQSGYDIPDRKRIFDLGKPAPVPGTAIEITNEIKKGITAAMQGGTSGLTVEKLREIADSYGIAHKRIKGKADIAKELKNTLPSYGISFNPTSKPKKVKIEINKKTYIKKTKAL